MLDFPLAPGPCLFSAGLEPGPWRRFPGVAQKPLYTSAYFHGFRRWRGNDNVLCSLRKIITKVVFELTAEGRVRCQVCVHFGCGSTCAPQDTRSRCAWGRTGPDEKLC